MDKNNSPGFTAEASLYPTNEHYSMAGTVVNSKAVVQPSLRSIGPLGATCKSTDGTSKCDCPLCVASENECHCVPIPKKVSL